MGEPVPGDFPDPIYLKTQNILLKTAQIGKAGDYAIYDNTGTPAWKIVNTTLFPAQGTILGHGLVQLQQDVNTTSPAVADAIANAGAFGLGSWFYGLANGAILPNEYVTLARTGTQFGFVNVRQLITSAAAVTANVITITTTIPHLLKEGDTVITSGFTPSNFNATLVVATITGNNSFTATLVVANATASVQGVVTAAVTANTAHAQFIKKSGATFSDGAVANDVCVFQLFTGDQPI